MKTFIASILAIWFALVYLLGANGAYVRPPETPPLPILLGATALGCCTYVVACPQVVNSAREKKTIEGKS